MFLIILLPILLPLFMAWLWMARWLAQRIIAGRIAEGGMRSLATWSIVLLMTVMVYQTLYVAWKNPFAHDAVTLRGRFPFDQGYELSFYQSATNSYDWHRRLCGWFGMVVSHASCTGAREVLTPKRVDAKHYSLTLYRDYYFKGVAGWQAGYGVNQYASNAEPSVRGLMKGMGPIDNRIRNYACVNDPATLKKLKGVLFCSDASTHKDYKSLIFTQEQMLDSNEHVLNFWLDSELDLLLKKGE